MQGRNRDTDVENKRMDTKGGKQGWGVVVSVRPYVSPLPPSISLSLPVKYYLSSTEMYSI